MKIVVELEHLYSVLNKEYTNKEFLARKNGYTKAEQSWKRKRELNEQAYFLFLFTRLEGHVRSETSKLITKKQTNLSGWKKQSVWRTLPKEKDKDGITFLNRVSLLINKGNTDFQRIKDYYDQRNSLGHGDVFTIPINMIDVFDDMKRFFKNLKY